MGYLIGAGPLDPAVKRYNGGTSSFTMDNSGTTNGTLLWVDGVAQVPGTDYNVSGTTITTTTAAGAGTNNVTSLQLFQAGVVQTPADNTVATAKIQDDAVTLAKMAAGTDGNIISYDTSGNPVAVATGNDGQVLTSSGAGAVCAFEDAGGGAWTLIGSSVASDSASLTQTGLSSTYAQYAIGLSGFRPASDSQELNLRLGDSGGIDSGSADYFYSNERGYNSGGASSHTLYQTSTVDAEHTSIMIQVVTSQGNAVGEGYSAMLFLEAPHSSNTQPQLYGRYGSTSPATLPDGGWFFGQRRAAIDVTQVQVFYASGNITAGRMSIWGIAHA